LEKRLLIPIPEMAVEAAAQRCGKMIKYVKRDIQKRPKSIWKKDMNKFGKETYICTEVWKDESICEKRHIKNNNMNVEQDI